MKKYIFSILFVCCSINSQAQIKILFDATKAETAGNADWVIDADLNNLGFGSGPATIGGGNEANPQRIPTPAQSGITATTLENYWKGGISSWGIDCVKKGYQVETLPYNGAITYGNSSNTQDLTNYKIFVVVEPNIVFNTTEKTAILNFVHNGGSLFMVSDHTVSDRNNDGWDSPAIWNDLFTNNGISTNPFGISFDLANISGSSTNITTNATDSLIHGSYGNVSQVLWSNGTTITINPTINPTVKAAVYKNGASNTGTTNVMVAYARYGLGKVVAVGDSSPFDDGTGDTGDQLYDGYITDAAGNHQKLIMNATVWLATSNLLPVKLTNFDCTVKNETVFINWQTATEINTSKFVLEKSNNAKDFFAVTVVEAKGSSQYSFIDLLNNIYQNQTTLYYRLKIVDNDGQVNYSQTRTLNFKPLSLNINVYPNPAKSFFKLENNSIDKVVLTDYIGKILLSQNITNNQQINISSLQQGIYFVQLFNHNKLYKVEKLIIQ